jgi:hypothetical protein
VPARSAETQAEAMDLSARDQLVRQRTQLVNAVRGHAADFGVIAAKGISQVESLLKIAETEMPQAAKQTLAQLGRIIIPCARCAAAAGPRRPPGCGLAAAFRPQLAPWLAAREAVYNKLSARALVTRPA